MTFRVPKPMGLDADSAAEQQNSGSTQTDGVSIDLAVLTVYIGEDVVATFRTATCTLHKAAACSENPYPGVLAELTLCYQCPVPRKPSNKVSSQVPVTLEDITSSVGIPDSPVVQASSSTIETPRTLFEGSIGSDTTFKQPTASEVNFAPLTSLRVPCDFGIHQGPTEQDISTNVVTAPVSTQSWIGTKEPASPIQTSPATPVTEAENLERKLLSTRTESNDELFVNNQKDADTTITVNTHEAIPLSAVAKDVAFTEHLNSPSEMADKLTEPEEPVAYTVEGKLSSSISYISALNFVKSEHEEPDEAGPYSTTKADITVEDMPSFREEPVLDDVAGELLFPFRRHVHA